MKKKKISIVKVGLVTFIFALSLTAIKLFQKEQALTKVTPGTTSVTPAIKKESVEENIFHWDTYTNEQYAFSIKHPRLMYKREFVNEGGYLYFLRFEETKFSQSKGLAIGVSQNEIETETKRIKKLMEEEGAILSSETELLVKEMKAKKLEFKPKEGESGEARSIVIVYGDPYSYSISSTPEQIEEIIQSFVVTSQKKLNSDRSQFCGGVAGLKCPAGFTCKLVGDHPDAGGECIKN